MRALPTRSRPARSAGVAFVLLLAGSIPGPSALTAAASPAPSPAPFVVPSIMPGGAPTTGALPADHRLLVPADVTLDGFVLPAAVAALGVSDPAAALADGTGGDATGDATYLESDRAGRPGFRVTLSGAPSGRVTLVRLGMRVRSGPGPATVTAWLRSGARVVAIGRAHPLTPVGDWVDVEDVFEPTSVGSAGDLRVQVSVTGTDGDARGVQVARISAEVELRVSLDLGPSPLLGGGRYTTIARSPSSGALLVGTSSAGIFRSPGAGRRFTPRNAALIEPDWMRVASVVFHPGHPGSAWLAAGDHGESGALFRTDDDGRTWQLVTGQLSFSAAVEPRRAGLSVAVGTLLVLADDAEGVTTIWAATTGHGLMRSVDAGRSWVPLGLSGRLLRGVVARGADPDTLYVATAGAGVWSVTGAWSASPVFRQVVGGPTDPQDLAWVDGTLFVAGGTQGLFRLEGDVLAPMNAGVPLDGPSWTTIGGAAATGGPVLFAACVRCATAADGAHVSIIRSLDGGATWAGVTGADAVMPSDPVAGPWLLGPSLATSAPGQAGFRPLDLIVRTGASGDPATADVEVAAEGALWHSTDGGDRWLPRVDGLGGAGARGLWLDPAQPDVVLTSLPGIGSVLTGDRFRTLRVDPWQLAQLPPLTDPVAYAVARMADADDAADAAGVAGGLVVAVASTGRPPAGDVVVAAAPGAPDPWIGTGFAAAFPDTRPTAVAAGRDASGAVVLVATVHPAGGIVRRIGDGPWVAADAGRAFLDPKGIARADLVWVPDTTILFVFDPATGIHRSTDAGATWSRIWEVRANRAPTARLAVAPDGSIVYASTNQGLYRLDGALQGTAESGAIGLSQLGTFRKPGPITLDGDGRLWVATEPLAGSPARLAVSWDPGADEPVFHDLASEAYANAVTNPDAIEVDALGRVLVADSEVGVWLGEASAVLREPWLPTDIVVDPLDRSEGPAVPIERLDPTIAPALVDPFVIHVAPDGDDAASGATVGAPVRTLARAQTVLETRFGPAAEHLDRDVWIQVRSGRYEGQSVRWTFTHPDHVVRIEGVAPGSETTKPRFVGCVDDGCASSRAWLELARADGARSNLQLLNIQVVKYHRAVAFDGGADPATDWNGGNVIHRCDFRNIGSRFRTEITPEVWSPGIITLDASRDNIIAGNRVVGSANRMRHTNTWFHTIYASHGSTGNVVQDNLIVDTSGDFHVRDASDGIRFARNVLVRSFYWALVTEWSATGERDVCGTMVDGNVAIGLWGDRKGLEVWHRETASPDGRCATDGVEDFVVTSRNRLVRLPGR